jgi:hypothetical protein
MAGRHVSSAAAAATSQSPSADGARTIIFACQPRYERLNLPSTASDADCDVVEAAWQRRDMLQLPRSASDADCETAEQRRHRLQLPHTASESDCEAAEAAAARALADVGTRRDQIQAGERVVVHDAEALRAAVADDGGAAVVELDPAGGVLALGTKLLNIARPVQLVAAPPRTFSAAGTGYHQHHRSHHHHVALVGGERGAGTMVRVSSPGVVIQGLELTAGTDRAGDQQRTVDVEAGGAALLCGCVLAGRIYVYGAAELQECTLRDITYGNAVNVTGMAGLAVLERCVIEGHAEGGGVRAVAGGVACLGPETTVSGCKDSGYSTAWDGGVIKGVRPELVMQY